MSELEPLTEAPKKSTTRRLAFLFTTVFLLIVSMYLGYQTLNTPPKDFPIGSYVTIEPGTPTRAIGALLKEQKLIRSEWFFYYKIIRDYDPRNIKASTYTFSEHQTTTQIIERLLLGEFGNDLLTLTFPEGIRVSLIGNIASRVLPNFNPEAFITEAETLEGKLYPDTYFVPVTFTSADLIELLTETHNQVMTGLRSTYKSNFSDEEVIVLASILEREANSEESMRMVSGILQNRLAINMALQADATMEYVLDKPLSELQPSDLQIDSPYNTYLYSGLPPTAIGNPGRTALEAVFAPTPSDYYFYITGNDGQFYYAKDFDEHRRNIARYLR